MEITGFIQTFKIFKTPRSRNVICKSALKKQTKKISQLSIEWMIKISLISMAYVLETFTVASEKLTNWKFQLRHICFLGKRVVIVKWQWHELAWYSIASDQALMHCSRSKVARDESASQASQWGAWQASLAEYLFVWWLPFLFAPMITACSQATFGISWHDVVTHSVT